jgi:hypothetical protein
MSNETLTLIPAGTPAPAHFALGYLNASISRLRRELEEVKLYTKQTQLDRLEHEITKLGEIMEQLNRELYPDLD